MPGITWSESDLTRLAELYPALPTAKVAIAIGRSTASTYNAAFKLGLKKSQEYLDSDESGRLKKGQTRSGSELHQFSRGHTPANKGLRRPGWAPGRMRETQFKNGNRSGIAAKNWHPIGTILPDREGYLRIKVREAVYGQEATGFGNTKVWPLYNRHVWEHHKGPIPPKHVVVFKDKDRANCAIDNLELISMAENVRRNSLWSVYPRELAEVIQLSGVLARKLRKFDGKE